MNCGSRASRSVPYLASALACLALPGTIASAQQNLPGGYEVTETNVASPEVAAQNVGPVRMARFCLIQGKINCRPSPKVNWAPAYLNQPIRQGEQIYVPANSRAEIAFDDGSIARLGGGAFVTMQTLYSDNQGEFTEVKLNDGLASFRLKNKVDVYQVDTPCCSVKATGPARFRVGARKSCEVADRAGNCTVEDHNGQTNLTPGKFVEVGSTDDALHAVPLPPDDSWERWNEDRDHVYDVGSPVSERYLPPNIALAAPDLDTYGTWDSEPNYGHVWYPRETEAGWRPYHHGHWVWVDPFGWTWVGNESWGWAPYHYGTWVHGRRGWGWCPGPAQQCWSPAVVSFSSYNGDVAWAPLAPEEVVYPSRLAIGFSGGDWSVLFSIGGAGAYYPGPDHRCYDRAWNNNYINQVTYVTNYNGYGGRPLYASNNNSYLGAGSWTPRNAQYGGGSVVSTNGFAGSGQYNNVSSSNIAAFQHGRAIGAPGNGVAPAVGPSHIRPTLASLTPGRSFSRAALPVAVAAVAARPLYRAALSPQVARSAPAFGNRLAAGAPGRANVAGRPGIGAANIPGRPGFGAANVPGTARIGNRPGTPGTSAISSLNRPGTPVNRTGSVPASVQAARRTMGVGNNRNVGASAPGRPTTTQRATAANTGPGRTNPGVTANHVAAVRRNPASAQVQAAHPVGTARRTGSFQNPAATNRSNTAVRRTTPTRTNTVTARPSSISRPSNQPARIARPAVQPRVQHNFAAPPPRARVSAPPVQNHVVHSAPRTFSTPQAAPRVNSGSFARPAPEAAPRGNVGGYARQAPQAPQRQAPQAPQRQAPQAPQRQAPQAPQRQAPQAPQRQAPQAPQRQAPQAAPRGGGGGAPPGRPSGGNQDNKHGGQ